MAEAQNRGNLDNTRNTVPRVTAVKSRISTNGLVKREQHRPVSKMKSKDNSLNNAKSRNKSVQFVRNTERPIKATKSSVSFTPSCQNDFNKNTQRSVHPEVILEENSPLHSGINLNAPELCTSLRFADKLLEEAVEESKSLYSEASLDAIKNKVANNINIPFEEQMYKNLVDLHVNEEDLFTVADRKFVSKPIIRNKDKEPELSDFYQPSYNEEFIVRPEKLKIEPEKVICFNGFSITDRMKNWKT